MKISNNQQRVLKGTNCVQHKRPIEQHIWIYEDIYINIGQAFLVHRSTATEDRVTSRNKFIF